ncbi:MAG: metallophosphoesterase, partial [Oscillospiraceae bacterium]|nr:metallophosphoesterase [Oscillospiraceae bacterium]
EFLRKCRNLGVFVLNNSSVFIQDIMFTGLTLPREVYKNQNGSYHNLTPVTEKLILSCIGACVSKPCVLLAHSPMGFEAYAKWGANIILSGHVHGGIIRMPIINGILSPERKFFPKYTKGVYQSEFYKNCYMNVSAGIGKFRVNNPSEIICIDFMPVKV